MNSRRSIHVARRALVIFVAWVCAPCLIILAMECLLWAMDYGRNTEPFLLIGQAPDFAYKHNPFFTLRFTNNDDTAEIVDTSFTAIPLKKGANTYRIFVFGGSAAQGFPYDCSFARMLQVLLTTRYPGVRFEICNLANAGLNSHIMRNLADVCRHMNPDAFIVYMGNNEVHGPYGLIHAEGNHVGRILTPTEIKLNMWLRGTRLWQLGRATVFGRWTIEKSAHRSSSFIFNDDPRLAAIWRNYHANLSAIFRSANAADAAVFIATLGVNLRHWPSEANVFQSPISDNDYTRWNDLLIAGKNAAANQRWEESLNIFRNAESINGASPELAFNMANCFYALDRYEEAREYYSQALELDGFYWVRAKEAVNHTLRSAVAAAQSDSVHLVEGRAALEAASPHGITGNDLFASGCHLRPKGAYVLAKAFFDKMTASLPERVTQQESPHADLPDWEECMLIVGMAPDLHRNVLNEIIKQREERGAPIEESLKQELLSVEDYDRFFNDEARLSRLLRFIERENDDYFYAGEFLSIMTQNTHMITPEIAPVIHRLAENHPCNRNIQYYYMLFLFHKEMFEEGMTVFQHLLHLYPSDYETYLAVIEMFIDRDRPEMAIAVLE